MPRKGRKTSGGRRSKSQKTWQLYCPCNHQAIQKTGDLQIEYTSITLYLLIAASFTFKLYFMDIVLLVLSLLLDGVIKDAPPTPPTRPVQSNQERPQIIISPFQTYAFGFHYLALLHAGWRNKRCPTATAATYLNYQVVAWVKGLEYDLIRHCRIKSYSSPFTHATTKHSKKKPEPPTRGSPGFLF